MPRTSVHRAIHTSSAKIASLFAQTVNHPTEELVTVGAGFARMAGSAAFNRVVGSIDGCHVRGDVLDPEDGEAGAAEEEDPGREAAPPGTVSGAEERNRTAALCYTPDHDYI
ncbi:unnamed protein product [Boreogadus saida]